VNAARFGGSFVMEPTVTERMPDPSTAHLNRGLALERVGRYSEAADAYREAARLEPGDLDPHLRLGLVLRMMGRDEEANEAFRAALDTRGIE
jgi:Flp pilus assembly protein TadD